MNPDILSQIMTTTGAGVLASLSPCVYPMIPIIVSFLGSEHTTNKKNLIFLFFLGQVLTFTTLGVVAVQLGEVFGFSTDNKWVNIGIGSFLLLMGLASYFNSIPQFMTKMNSKFNHLRVKGHHQLINAFLIGLGSALVASPCTSPILGSVLAQIAQQDSIATGITLMFFYALGKSFIFLGLGLGFVKAKELPRAGKWMTKVHQATTVFIFFAACFYFYRGLN